MTTSIHKCYGTNSRQIKPAVVNLFQANNNVDRLEFQMENYNQDNVNLSNLDPYVICHGSQFVGSLDEVKLTSEVTEDGLLRVYWDLTLMVLSSPQTITAQLVFKNEQGAVWTSYKFIIFCNESLTADEEIVAQYPTILKQMEGRIETTTDEAVEGAVTEITNNVNTQVNNAITHVNQMAENFDASVVYIPYGETIPVEQRVSNRLYYQYMNYEHTKGRFEDSEGTILIVDESGEATYAPIGAIIPVNVSSKYIPDGCLPCDGAEYTKAMFKDLWNNWLTSEDYTVIEQGWQIPTTEITNTLRSVIYVNNKYYMLGSNHDVLMSNDGITWNESVSVGDKAWNCITYGDGRFVMVNSYGQIANSTDGTNWSEPITITDRGWTYVTYGNGKFVAVGLSGYVITSDDGVNWGTPFQVGTALWNCVTYGNGRFVAIGDYTVITSTDGVNWNEPVSVEGKYYYSVCYGNGKFVATGSYGNVLTSEDGVNWSKQAAVDDSITWMSVTYTKDKFVAVGTKGNITTSVDGVTWTEPVVVSDKNWTSVTCGDDKLVAVGYSGAMAYNEFELKYATRLNTCSYIEYLEDLAAYGQCGKFAVNSETGTFRVPTIKDGAVVQQAMTNDELCKVYNAGLPNITGTMIGGGSDGTDPQLYSGAFNYSGSAISKTNGAYPTEAANTTATFDAWRSSNIYGKSDTVQMDAVAIRYFVVVANGQINQSMMDWGEWGLSLQSKANIDLENSTPTANFATLLNNVGIRTVVETYSNGKSWYRKYSDGWVEQGGAITGLKDTEFTAVTFLVPIQEPTAGFMAQMTGGSVMSGTNVVAAIGYIPNNTTLYLAISDYGSFSDIAYWTAWGVMAQWK